MSTHIHPFRLFFAAPRQATSGCGWVATLDHTLLVRKAGDPGSASPAEAAPCCRASPGVVAMQLGRPISNVDYRSKMAQRQASALGWSDDYWQAGLSCSAVAPQTALLGRCMR